MKKSILITGASSGMGYANTVLFSERGYEVFATYRSVQDGVKLGKLKNVHPIQMDVTNGGEIQQAFHQISNLLGNDGLYAIINNAGAAYTAPFEFASEQRANQVMEINLMAPYKITQTFIPLLKKHNAQNPIKARVINIASWAAYMGQPFIPFYNASKAGLAGLTESMYYDLGLLDIHAVLASPGTTKTPFLGKTTDDGIQNVEMLPEQDRAFYQPYLDHLKSMGENFGNSKVLATPEKLALRLFKIVEAKKPKFKYNLSSDAFFVDKIITKWIPFRWRAALNKRMFRLNDKKMSGQNNPRLANQAAHS